MIDDEGVSEERDELYQLVLCCCDGHALESREIQRDLHVGRSCLEPLILDQILFCLVNGTWGWRYIILIQEQRFRGLVYLKRFDVYENETMSFLEVVGNEEERIFWGGRKNILNLKFLLLVTC